MAAVVGASAPYVPTFFAQPQWVGMSHAGFEPACLKAVDILPDSTYMLRKASNHPDIYTSGRCAIGIYLTNPPATSTSPKATTWKSIKKYVRQTVSQLGRFDDERDDGSTHGVSLNIPSGMQIAVYERPYIDPHNKCGTVATFQTDRRLTLEECLRQRAIEKGLLPPDPIAATISDDDWNLSPQEISAQLAEYVRSYRAMPLSLTEPGGVPPSNARAGATTSSTPSPRLNPAISPARARAPSPMPIASPALSPPTPPPFQPSSTVGTRRKKKQKNISTQTSSASLTIPSGPVDFADEPIEVNVLRSQWARHGKLTPALCNRALALFRHIYRPDDVLDNIIAMSIPEFFVTSPCAVGVYLTYPDQKGLETVVKENWINIEKKARLLALDVTKRGGSGGYINLKSGVQIAIFDKPFLDPSTTLQDYPNIPLVHALDQRIYARQHGGTTIPWTPQWHPTYPTVSISATLDLGGPSSPLGNDRVFVGLLDSWTSHRALSYVNCLGAIRMLQAYPPALEQPTLTLERPMIFAHDTCAIGIFVTEPPAVPHPAINVLDMTDVGIVRYAVSLVEVAVRELHIGAFVDTTNGMQIAVWEKPWVDPGNICGRITRVSLQNCLDQMVEYNSRVRKHAMLFASIEVGGGHPASSDLAAAISELQAGGSAVASGLMGSGYNEALTLSNRHIALSTASMMLDPVFQITMPPPMVPGDGENRRVGPMGSPLGRLSQEQESILALRNVEYEKFETALNSFWNSLSNRSLQMGVGSRPAGPALGVNQSQGLGLHHLGGVVLPGNMEGAGPRRPDLSAPQLGDAYSSPRVTKGIVVGEAAWVNQQAFLTAKGPVSAAATGRVILVGGDPESGP